MNGRLESLLTSVLPWKGVRTQEGRPRRSPARLASLNAAAAPAFGIVGPFDGRPGLGVPVAGCAGHRCRGWPANVGLMPGIVRVTVGGRAAPIPAGTIPSLAVPLPVRDAGQGEHTEGQATWRKGALGQGFLPSKLFFDSRFGVSKLPSLLTPAPVKAGCPRGLCSLIVRSKKHFTGSGQSASCGLLRRVHAVPGVRPYGSHAPGVLLNCWIS